MWQDPANGQRRRAWAFVLMLSYSRHVFVRVVLELTCHMWLGCHILAVEFFGGVPPRIVR